MKPLPTLIPKHMTRVCEEITTIFRENFRDFHQWADDNLTQEMQATMTINRVHTSHSEMEADTLSNFKEKCFECLPSSG